MKITFLTPCDNLTGGARVVAMYARELMALGHDVLVVACAPDPVPWRERLRQKTSALWGAEPKGADGFIRLSGVPMKTLDRLGPITAADVPDADVVIATWWETAVWMHGFPAAKGRRVHMIQGYEVWFGGDTVPRVHAALQLPNTKFAISHDLQRTIMNALGPLPIHVVPNAVDPTQFDAPVRDKNVPPCIGFVYSTAAIKGADICIEACRIVRQQFADLRVVSFGADQPTDALALPPSTHFEWRPAQDQLRNVYAACDVWLFGSRLDSFGLPILEALACRTPVVATPVGAAQALLAPGGGVVVAPESASAMAEAVGQILQRSAQEWRAMSDVAYATAHGYTWRDAAQRLLKILESAP